jgi:hypothetical protein
LKFRFASARASFHGHDYSEDEANRGANGGTYLLSSYELRGCIEDDIGNLHDGLDLGTLRKPTWC